MSSIKAAVVNDALACSSIVIGYVWTPLDFHEKTLKDFATEIRDKFKPSLCIFEPLEKYAFVVASTSVDGGYERLKPNGYYDGYIVDAEKAKKDFKKSKKHHIAFMRRLGFKATKEVWCEKNSSHVRFWTVSAAELSKTLKEIIDDTDQT